MTAWQDAHLHDTFGFFNKCIILIQTVNYDQVQLILLTRIQYILLLSMTH